jgi:hypothetical protein
MLNMTIDPIRSFLFKSMEKNRVSAWKKQVAG